MGVPPDEIKKNEGFISFPYIFEKYFGGSSPSKNERAKPLYPQLERRTSAGAKSRSHSVISPAAQPTPASTVIAPAAQFIMHAPHSMQASRSRTQAFLSSIQNTSWGHTSAHLPQPTQRSGS
jgi:hypothetical protein